MATCSDKTASTTRTKRIRGAHRGAITRLINKVSEVTLSGDISRLKQLNQALVNKRNVLLTLDEELLLVVGEEELDSEIEQADSVRERADLAIIGLEEILANRSSKRFEEEPLRNESRLKSEYQRNDRKLSSRNECR